MTDTIAKAIPTSQVEPDDLMDMVDDLALEVPDYLEESLVEVKPIGTFDFTEILEVPASATVYQVQLESGEKVYAVSGGFFEETLSNVYAEKFPTAEIAAKAHIYVSALLIERGNSVAKVLRLSEQVASQLSLPQWIRGECAPLKLNQ